GSADCCARAPSGQLAALPISDIKSRLLIEPRARKRQFITSKSGCCASQQKGWFDFRNGSKAVVGPTFTDVGFTPRSRPTRAEPALRKSARRRLSRCSKRNTIFIRPAFDAARHAILIGEEPRMQTNLQDRMD